MGLELKEKEKISGQLESSDPFQNKLDEVDQELRKFEDATSENRPDKGGVSERSRQSAIKCPLVSATMGLGPPILERGNLVSICTRQGPTESNPGIAGPIKSPPPSSYGSLSPKARAPLQAITKGFGRNLKLSLENLR